jgi:shikimate kinase
VTGNNVKHNQLLKKIPLPLFFCGLKHCGKSTLGSLIAEKHHLQFSDADDLILDSLQTQYARKITVREYYRTFGREAFAEIEFASLRNYLAQSADAKKSRLLVALGGGACDNNRLIQHIRISGGTIFYIQQDEKILLTRIMKNGIPPFLDQNAPEVSFHNLFRERDEKYRVISDYIIDISGDQPIEQSAGMINNFLMYLEAGE